MPTNAQREERETHGGTLSSCWGKARFAPGQKALAIKVGQRMSRSKHSKMTPFRCPHCDGWHIGQSLGLRR
jgi:hypothetical protein